jgi:hypothetical protein
LFRIGTSPVICPYPYLILRTAVLDLSAAKNIGLPWTQLMSLTLRHMALCDSKIFLKQAPNLVHCGSPRQSLRVSSSSRDQTSILEVVVLQRSCEQCPIAGPHRRLLPPCSSQSPIHGTASSPRLNRISNVIHLKIRLRPRRRQAIESCTRTPIGRDFLRFDSSSTASMCQWRKMVVHFVSPMHR